MTIATDHVGIGTDDDSNGDYVGGDDADFAFLVTDTDGNEVDVSNANSIEWIIAESKYEDTNIIQKTQSGGGITVDDGGSLSKQSRVVVHVDGSETEDFGGSYYHELEITDADGDKETSAKGPFVAQDSPNDS